MNGVSSTTPITGHTKSVSSLLEEAMSNANDLSAVVIVAIDRKGNLRIGYSSMPTEQLAFAGNILINDALLNHYASP